MWKTRGLVFFAILAFAFLYTGLKAQQLLPGRKTLAWSLAVAYFSLIITWQFIYRWNNTVLDTVGFQFLAWTGSLALGFWAMFILFSIPMDLYHLGISLTQRLLNAAPLPLQPARRDFLAQWVPLGLLGVSGGLSGYGFKEVLFGPRVKEIQVPIQDLPKELEGLKIVQISDLHVGPTIRHDYVARVVEKVRALQPDLIAVTGDLADGVPEILAQHLEPLKKLKAPLGTFYCTGNHEYYWGGDLWVEKARSLGFTPLLNENREVQFRGTRFLVAGVTDPFAGQFIPSHATNPQKAGQSEKEYAFKLLLAHRPDSCFEAEPQGFHLQLSGHTHAGQFFPWSLLVRLVHRYYQGLNRHGRMWVYVNAGTGYWGPANRFAVPSEISLLKLSSVGGKTWLKNG